MSITFSDGEDDKTTAGNVMQYNTSPIHYLLFLDINVREIKL